MKSINLAIVGVTGLVGRNFLKILEERNVNINKLYLFASEKSAGRKVFFKGKEYIIEELTQNSIDNKNIDIALFSAGKEISIKFANIFAQKNCIVIDNSSAFRMDRDIPLIVPEVNKDKINLDKKIIANPNCSTIQGVLVLKPLHDVFNIKRVIYSTYQAVSGAGTLAIKDLEHGALNKPLKKFIHPIYSNCIPHIDSFESNGYTKEEMKIINETKKILDAYDIKVTATAVRVPVINSHSESINIEFVEDFQISDIIEVLKNAPGIVVEDNIESNVYPMPINATNKNETFVGRIRRDESVDRGINIWVVSDNIRKGAALNAIQILECVLEKIQV